MEQMKGTRSFEWNERFQKSIFDLTEEERTILKAEAKERKLKREMDSKFNSNSVELFNVSRNRINEIKEVVKTTNVNLVHNSNSLKVFGSFENMRNFLKKAGISNKANYLFGMKTSY